MTADPYVFTVVDYPNSIWISLGRSNNLNQTVGWYSLPSGYFSFMYDNGNFNTINFNMSQILPYPVSINDHGDIAGTYLDGANNSHQSGFFFSGGIFQKIDLPGSNFTAVSAINNSDQMVGTYRIGDDIQGFLYQEGVFTTLTTPLGTNVWARDINSAGDMVVWVVDTRGGMNNGTGSYLVKDDVYTKIEVPGAMRTEVWGINDRGQIVGQYTVAYEGTHGFLKDGDTYVTLDFAAGSDTRLGDINNNGMIIGQAHEPGDTNNSFSFIAMPSLVNNQVPEPATLFLLFGGLAGIGWLKKRKFGN